MEQILKNNRSKYFAIHYWLKYNFGVATKCENKECPQKSKSFDWAKLKGKEYDFKRKNFFQLCHSCHKKYDTTEELRQKMRELSLRTQQKVCVRGHSLEEGGTMIYVYRKHGDGNRNFRERQCLLCRRIRAKKGRLKRKALKDAQQKIREL